MMTRKICRKSSLFARSDLALPVCLSLLFLCGSYTPAFACKHRKARQQHELRIAQSGKDSVTRKPVPFDLEGINSSGTTIDRILDFARQQLGVPYKYASADPAAGGLDCSGFLYYVFGHFHISVPRSSHDYLAFGKGVETGAAQKGDVIIFTGSDASERSAGHVGIILDTRDNDIRFIHGSSGRGQGVIISSLSETYYRERFLKIVRVLKD